MLRVPVLPCLPGFNFDRNLGRTKFHRSQCFDKVHNDIYYLTEKKYDFGRYPSIYPRGEVQELPPWIAYDGQRLMFDAYYQETVQERWKSSFQIRVVTISFFLEDGTMKISEPIVDNSGLEQGVLVRRQRIPLPDPIRYKFYDIIDLNIGKEPEIFGRVYKIVNCDKFTRQFLNRMGIPVPDPIKIPLDPYIERRKLPFFPKKPKSHKLDHLRNFLKYDRQVLRFYGYWDDTESAYGIIHDLEIHYYLADDTMEIKENVEVNSGRDSGCMLVKRMKIPKFYSGLDPIGEGDPYTILNVMGEDINQSYMMIDALNIGKSKKVYYKDNELSIGAKMDIFGRTITITDMDAFTKEYYRTKYGLNDFTPLEKPQKKDEVGEPIERYIPPYNGYGTYEDSLGNCLSIIPKPPQTDFIKFLYYDKQGFDSKVLRFRAQMISKIPENLERQFIIRFYLIDDSISIFELTKRNSGFRRCLFLRKMPIMLPKQEIFSSKKPEYYKPGDFYIGACLNINEFHFSIISADIYALRYMEINSKTFPKANIKLIMEKLKEALTPVYKEFIQNHSPSPVAADHKIQTLEYDKFKKALCTYLGDKITEHEIITVARHYSSHKKKEFHTREYVRQLVHTELNRDVWNEADRMKEDLLHWDRGRTGYLPRNTIYTVLRSCRIPLDIELINSMLDHLCKNEDGKIDYNDLMEFIDIKVNPLPPAVPINIKTALWWASEKEPDCGAGIDWHCFIKDLDIKTNDDTLEFNKAEEKENCQTKK
ncbi:EF-hand domain-containing family member C2 [Vespula squamosa]|uniref:EF-hand domain-containing family member C2 n=1 Tax=Vespula squamosa TaxID=30214 RepID=A0ABD2A1I5_VESSQ